MAGSISDGSVRLPLRLKAEVKTGSGLVWASASASSALKGPYIKLVRLCGAKNI